MGFCHMLVRGRKLLIGVSQKEERLEFQVHSKLEGGSQMIYLKSSCKAHCCRAEAKRRNGASSSSTSAFRMTGLSLPFRRSMAIMLGSGVPPTCHCSVGDARLERVDISPVCLAPSNAPAACPSP